MGSAGTQRGSFDLQTTRTFGTTRKNDAIPRMVPGAAASSKGVADQPYRNFIAMIGAIKASVAAFDPIRGQSPIAIP